MLFDNSLAASIPFQYPIDEDDSDDIDSNPIELIQQSLALLQAGSIKDMESTCLDFLYVFGLPLIASRPSFRVIPSPDAFKRLSGHPEMIAKVCGRIAEYLLESRYTSELPLKCSVLLYAFAPYLLPFDCNSLVALAEQLNVTKGCISKQYSKMECFFSLKTIHSNKKTSQ